MKQSNWKASGKPQEKPKQSHARRRQKKKQFKNLANKLREGSGKTESFLLATMTDSRWCSS
jgi:hypothetical protein